MTKTEQYILSRLDNLERAFIKSQENNSRVTQKADMVPVVEIKVNDLGDEVETNTADISDNRDGLMEAFESGMENLNDIADCRNAIEEIYEII